MTLLGGFPGVSGVTVRLISDGRLPGPSLHGGEAREPLAENDKLRETAHRLSVEYKSLRETAHQLLVENNALRKRAARRLAAGILLTLGIVAFLSLHVVAMLGEPSVRSGTVASSGQAAPEAAARSGGLPTQAERRATISGPPLTAAAATPEPPTPLDSALASVEDLTTWQATLPRAIAAPGQTARAPEAPPSVASPDPAEKHATPPATSPTTSRPPTQSPPNQHPSITENAALVTRGDAFLSAGDIVSARLFYERAADGGDGGAALRLGATFDLGFLGRTGVRGALGDPARASSWYRRALDLGNPAAQERLKNLERQRVPEPGPLPH
jgi:hypothetical protein